MWGGPGTQGDDVPAQVVEGPSKRLNDACGSKWAASENDATRKASPSESGNHLSTGELPDEGADVHHAWLCLHSRPDDHCPQRPTWAMRRSLPPHKRRESQPPWKMP